MASSSSSPFSFEPLSSSSVPKHDIFLSHSGAQKPFVTALYKQLRTCYSTFFDITHHSLPPGEDFPSHIFHAARTCRLAVVVLSHEYLLSKWPMLELCAFVEAKPPPPIMPLFFTLLPKDLQQKQNQKVWRRAWAKFAKKDSRIDVSKWDSALKELRNRNGIRLDLSDGGESACIDKVVSCICKNLPPSFRDDFSGVPGIHRMSQDILDQFDKLDINGSKACVLGMYGLPGSGKSTLCRYLCDHPFLQCTSKVLYLELPTDADDEKLLVKSKVLLNQLTNFKNKMDLSTVSHLGQVCNLLRGTDFSNSRVFLVVDNISSEKSQNFVIKILELGLAVGSKVLLVARSRSILCRPLLQEDGPHPSSRYDYGCMSVPSLNKEEALRVLLQSRGGVGLADASALEAALTPRHRQIMEEVLSMSSFGKKKEYLPLVLTIMGEQLRQHEPDLEDWKRMMTSFWTGVGMCKEKALKQLVLQNFKALPQKLQTLFLDAALFIIPLSYLDGESNMVGEAFLHLSLIQGCKREEIKFEMQELQKHGFLTIWEHKYSTPTISVHDVYLEFAASIEEASQYYWSSGLRWSNVERNQSIEVARNTELGLRTVVLELEEGCEELKFCPQLSRVKAMVLRNCKSLNILWGFANLICLASLEIRNCPSLKWVEPPATGCEWPYLQRVRWINQEEKGHGAERAQQQDRRDTASVSMKLLWKAFREFVLRMGMPRRGVMEVACLLLQMRGLEVLRLENADIGQGMDLNGCLPQLRVLEVASEHMKQFCVCNLPNLEELVYSGDVHSYSHWSAMKSGHSWPHGSGLFHEGSRSRVVIGRDFLAGCPKLQRVCVMDAFLEDELQGFTIPSSHLKELWVNSLRNLSSLPALTAAPESLKWLTLRNCPKVKSANFGRTYGSLRALYLGDCSNVTEVTGLDGLPNLQELSIEDCTSLKTVSGLGGLVRLREFKVRGGCPNLQRCLLHDLESLTEVKRIEYDGPWLMDGGFNVRGLANLGFLELVGTITTGTLVGVESLNRLKVLTLVGVESLNRLEQLRLKGTGVTGSDGTLLVDLATLLGVAEPSDLSSLGSLTGMQLGRLRMLASLKGIEFLPSLENLELQELPNLTCLQGIEALGELESLSLTRCASVEELPSLSTLVNLVFLTCRDCLKLSSVEGCGRLQDLQSVSFERCKSLARFPLLDWEYWTRIVMLDIQGSKFASVEAAMEWAEDKEAPQLLRTASMAALHWELSQSSTDHNRENVCEMLLDKVLLKVAQRCDNGDDHGEESFPTRLSKLSLLAKIYHDFEHKQGRFPSIFYPDLFFNNNSEIAQMYHESMPSMQLEDALRCFAQLPKQRLVAQCRSDPNFPFFVLHLFNRACTSTSFP